MSNKLRDRWIISLRIPDADREILMSKFPPAHPLIYCERLTIEYGVPRGYRVPFDTAVVLVHSYHRNNKCDAFWCEVNAKNLQVKRPGEDFHRRYHITLSTVQGMSPAIAGLPADMGGLDDGNVTGIFNPVHTMTLKPIREPIRKHEPRQIVG